MPCCAFRGELAVAKSLPICPSPLLLSSDFFAAVTEITSTPTLSQRLLRDCRELLVRELGEWLKELGPHVVEKLRELADNTSEIDKRNEYLHLRDEVQLSWNKLHEAFCTRLARELEHATPLSAIDSAVRDEPHPLALVDDQELTERIVTREFIARLSESCSEEMYALDRRVAQLVGQEEMDRCGNRFGPQAICAAAQAGCEAMLKEPAARNLLLRQLERALHAELPLQYHALNEVLIGAGILPEFKRSYRHASPRRDTDGLSPTADAGNILDTLQRLARARMTNTANMSGVPVTPVTPANFGVTATTGTTFAEMAAALPTGGGVADVAPLMPPGGITVSADFLASLKALQLQALPAATSNGGSVLTNVVRLARESAAAQHAAPLETITMDIVATLFDLIFEDDKVPEPVKGLVSRLQIPVLKVAMLDQKFFADRGHPARRFLDSISGITIRWGGAINTGDPFYSKLSELVERIQSNFDQDVTVFGDAVAELSTFVNEREALEETTSNCVVEVVQQREEAAQARLARAASAGEAAAQLLEQIITRKTPLPIEQFLRGQWRTVLESIGTDEAAGVNSAAFQAAVRVAEDLAWSVTTKRLTEDRERLAALLPRLLPALQQGLDRIGVSAESRQPLFDALINLHAAALHADRRTLKKAPALATESSANESATETVGNLLQVTHLLENGIQIEAVALIEAAPQPASGSEPESAPAPSANPWLHRVKQLVRGDWVEFIDDGAEENADALSVTRRERLTWLSPQRTVYIFSNHATNCAISITPEALAHRLQNATARLIEHETPLFERALEGAIKVLDPSAQK